MRFHQKMHHYIQDSIQGTERSQNKDSILILEKDAYTLFIIFDGISSSKNALRGILLASNFIKESSDLFLGLEEYNLPELMYEVNKITSEEKNSELGAYATFSAIAIKYAPIPSIVGCSLGDSRIYGLSKNYLRQDSKDDNIPQNPNIVTKSLGMVELNKDDFKKITLSPERNERILLCTDGFYSVMERELARFHSILNFRSIRKIRSSLFTELHQKNQDDASYILINKKYV